MYFIRYEALKKKLTDRALSDREALPYLLILVGLTTMLTSIPLIGGDVNKWDVLSAFLNVVVAIAGMFYAYKQNGGNEGYDLIQKYVVLGWVVFVRFLICLMPALILCAALGEYFGVASFEETGPYEVIIIFLAEVVFYQRLGRHIRDTNVTREASPIS
ncbi:MAG: hypothetical protein JXR79_05900 [Nitrospirae bacterium]|nr:hypothetical protein [Nitrospirota bacterium]